MTGKPREEADRYLRASGMNSKVAILMCLGGLDREEAERALAENDGFLRAALNKESFKNDLNNS